MVNVIKRIVVVALMLPIGLLGLSACSGGSSTKASTAAPTTAGTAVAGQTGNSASTGKKSAGTVLSIPDQFCVFLDQELPKLTTQASSARAQDKAAVDYKAWVKLDKDRKFKKTELDPIATSRCPKVRSRLLSTTNGDNLAGVLN